MKPNSHSPENRPSEETWESDSVWKLLDAATTAKASPRFADNALRAARSTTQEVAWWKSWKSLFAPAPLAGLSATAAIIAMTLAFFLGSPSSDTPLFPHDPSLAAEAETIEIEDIIASIDEISELSDSELIALIGY